MAAVIASLAGAFAAVSLFSFVVATQVSDLAQNTPVYQINILTKVRALKENGLSGGEDVVRILIQLCFSRQNQKASRIPPHRPALPSEPAIWSIDRSERVPWIAPHMQSHTVANPYQEEYTHSIRDDEKCEGDPIARLRQCREI
jgi:hypothetical protein